MTLFQLGERDSAHFFRRPHGVGEPLRRRLAGDDFRQGGGGFGAGIDHVRKLAAPVGPAYPSLPL